MIHLRHKWEAVAARKMEWVLYTRAGTLFGEPSPITEVLQRCPCGKVRTVTLDGTWTLEQVRGEA